MASLLRSDTTVRLVAGTAGATLAYLTFHTPLQHDVEKLPWANVEKKPPTRREQLTALKKDTFDILVIGGGATGAGVAFDASTRGLKTALVEAQDFGSGSTAKSSKLAHGGLPYLKNAVSQLDWRYLPQMVYAVGEREHLLSAGRHVVRPLPTYTPCYEYWHLPYLWTGTKAGEAVAWAAGSSVGGARCAGAWEAQEELPALAERGPGGASSAALAGAVAVPEVQLDAARLCVALACSAAMQGAAVANYVKVVGLLRDTEGRVRGARCRDMLTQREFGVEAATVVNASGAAVDDIRQLDDKASENMVCTTRECHVALPLWYAGARAGAALPAVAGGGPALRLSPIDGAALLSFEESPEGQAEAAGEAGPGARAGGGWARAQVREEEVNRLLEALQPHLGIPVRKQDVQAAWSEVRARVCGAAAEAAGGREFAVAVSEAGLVSVAGGHWTTYRLAAQSAVDKAVEVGELAGAGGCTTAGLPLVGSARWRPALVAEMMQSASGRAAGVGRAEAERLARAYGDRAPRVLAVAAERGLAAGLPGLGAVLEAEVVHCAEAEYCAKPADFLARRTAAALADRQAAEAALPRVVQLMGDALKWSWWRRARETWEARRFLATFRTANKLPLACAPPPPPPAPAPAPAPSPATRAAAPAPEAAGGYPAVPGDAPPAGESGAAEAGGGLSEVKVPALVYNPADLVWSSVKNKFL